MKKQIFRITLLCFAVVNSTFASRLSIKDLNGIFSGSCKTQGQFTTKALNDTNSLISIIEEVRDDKDCKSVISTVSRLRTLQQTLTQIESSNDSALQLEKLKAKESEILGQILLSSDPATTAQLNDVLRSIQVDAASLQTQVNFETTSGQNMRNLYQNVVDTTESTLGAISSNTQCLNKNAGLLSSVVTLGASIAAATYTTFPAYALGLSAATQILGSTIEYFRKRPYQLIIRRISNSTLALEGYRCALESLSDRWCTSKDAERILKLKAKLRAQNINNNFNSKDIIVQNDHEIPAFIDWLKKVRAGAKPSSTSEGQRRSQVISREAEVQTKESNGLGIIADGELRFSQSSSPVEQLDALKLVIKKIVKPSCSGNNFSSYGGQQTPSIFEEIFGGSSDRAAYYLLGITDVVIRSNTNVNFCQFRVTDRPGFQPNYKKMKKQFTAWIAMARAIVAEERVRTMQSDARSTLTQAFDLTSNSYRIAPLDAIKRIRDFLKLPENLNALQNANALTPIYKDTITRLDKIAKIIEVSIYSDDPSIATALQKIAVLANLKNGVYLFQNRLEMVLRNTLQNYLRAHISADSELSTQLLAADSFLETLKIIKGSDNLALILNDISNSQNISLNNMKALMDTFGKNIRNVLKNIHKDLNNTNDPQLKEVYSRTMGQFCLLISSMPKWPKHIPQKYCIGTYLKAVLAGGPQSPKINATYLNQSFSKRSCGYRNFLRKSKIYQDWGIKL